MSLLQASSERGLQMLSCSANSYNRKKVRGFVVVVTLYITYGVKKKQKHPYYSSITELPLKE